MNMENHKCLEYQGKHGRSKEYYLGRMPRKTSIPRGIKKKWAWATKKLPPSVLSLTSQQIKSAYGVTEKKCSAGTCRFVYKYANLYGKCTCFKIKTSHS